MNEASSHAESASRRQEPCPMCGAPLQVAPFSGTKYCPCEYDPNEPIPEQHPEGS